MTEGTHSERYDCPLMQQIEGGSGLQQIQSDGLVNRFHLIKDWYHMGLPLASKVCCDWSCCHQ